MKWRQVDLKAGKVRLDPGTTQNLEGRVFYLTSELRTLLADQRKGGQTAPAREEDDHPARVLPRRTTQAGDVVFLAGQPIAPSGFDHAWC